MMRRRGRPGLVGTMARTAVIAGTATAVVGGVSSHNAKKSQAAADQQAVNQAAVDSQQQLADMQSQVDEMKADQAPAPAAAVPAAAGGIDDATMAELTKLADLKSAGILTDSEFIAAKAKILGI
jgi:hypothetical protein